MTAGVSADPPTRMARRRAVEALRAGVPNRDAVALLGSGQPAIEDRFVSLLEYAPAGASAGQHRGGLLLGGGFGAGKSHLLTHLARLAGDAGYVTSPVVVSKETPLHDPAKVFRSAADAALLPGRYGAAIDEAAGALDPDSPAFAELLRWAESTGAGLNERFPASLLVFAEAQRGRLPGEEEFVAALLRFWAGDPLRVGDLRRRLKLIGQGKYPLPSVPARELARQRLRFATRLFAAAGYAGWVVLFDEVELIGRYSLAQRARSYAEVARWLRGEHGDAGLPLLAVLAMTDDFEASVIAEKKDRDTIPAKLRGKQSPDSDALAGEAAAGMRLIDRAMLVLDPPDASELDHAYAELKRLHGEAFGWDPPDVPGLERLGATRMRQYVRAWINEWDLVRLDPAYAPQTEAVPLTPGYAEDVDLEGNDGDSPVVPGPHCA